MREMLPDRCVTYTRDVGLFRLEHTSGSSPHRSEVPAEDGRPTIFARSDLDGSGGQESGDDGGWSS